MFYSLPIEVQLDVLKCLNFNQLFSFKQINFYSLNLINKYENGLARMYFSWLEIGYYNFISFQEKGYKIIVPESVTSEFILNDQLLEKWKAAIARSIPLYLVYDIEEYDEFAEFSICLVRPKFLLKLPNIPKNIEEMLIIRFWLEQLFKCAFREGSFGEIVLNPEMINLLFDNDKTIPLQFNTKYFSNNLFENNTVENILKFVSNHLTSTDLKLNLQYVEDVEQYINILFNILTNEGNKFHKIYLRSFKVASLHDLLIEYITTSRDCSKMVADIHLEYIPYPKFKLHKNAKNARRCTDLNIIKYEFVNIYNPEVRYLFTNWSGSTFIKRMWE
uniref:F-box domain-containing protein n=1 Tax=Meloidogyne enterolobii TaxID=390850 RepID=A0A6V7ULY3_MELEN|nr:unnamed protein product [Meloidogyne enterolobii]